MDDKFLKAIDRVLGHEGGYVNDPADPGGETNWGISKRSYPNLNIKELTRDQAIAIYEKDFWIPLHAEILSDGAGYQLLDSAVNNGISQSIRLAQRALNIADDGIAGPHTQEVLRSTSETDFIMLFLAERLLFLTKLKAWDRFGRGWARRIALNLKYGAEDS